MIIFIIVHRIFQDTRPKYRRAKALYDCEADLSDELTFVEGEIIVMMREADPDWWVSCMNNLF